MLILLSGPYIVFIMQRLNSLGHIGHSCPVHRSVPVPKLNVANAHVLVNSK